MALSFMMTPARYFANKKKSIKKRGASAAERTYNSPNILISENQGPLELNRDPLIPSLNSNEGQFVTDV